METIIIATLGIAVIVLSAIILKLRSDIKKVAKVALESEFDVVFAMQKIEEQQEIINNLSFKKNDDFVTFLEESRDMAFTYIETVQDAITKFVEATSPTLEYYDKFGRINETKSMNIIFDAYQELVKVLPETENNKQGENNE